MTRWVARALPAVLAAVLTCTGCGLDPGAALEPTRTAAAAYDSWVERWQHAGTAWSQAWYSTLVEIDENGTSFAPELIAAWGARLGPPAADLDAALARAGPPDSRFAAASYGPALRWTLGEVVAAAAAAATCREQECADAFVRLLDSAGAVGRLVTDGRSADAVQSGPVTRSFAVDRRSLLQPADIDRDGEVATGPSPLDSLCVPTFGGVRAHDPREGVVPATEELTSVRAADGVVVAQSVQQWRDRRDAVASFQALGVRAHTCPLEPVGRGRSGGVPRWQDELAPALGTPTVAWRRSVPTADGTGHHLLGVGALVDDTVVVVTVSADGAEPGLDRATELLELAVRLVGVRLPGADHERADR
ncbi:MAG: hypothetical protein JWP95_625 [Actinotalea sp.]|nr:hypothetical protein [Actinotalea sp.]